MNRISLVALLASLVLTMVAHRRWVHAIPEQRIAGASVPARAAAPGPEVDPDSMQAMLVARDVFRLDISTVHPTERAAGTAMPSPSRPVLVIKAIVGPPWQAIVDGIPGQPPGTIVQSGATYGGVGIASVGRDSVRIRATDTEWTIFYKKGT